LDKKHTYTAKTLKGLEEVLADELAALGAKDIVLKLVDHSNEELSRQALTCVSKMMVQNWQVSDK